MFLNLCHAITKRVFEIGVRNFLCYDLLFEIMFLDVYFCWLFIFPHQQFQETLMLFAAVILPLPWYVVSWPVIWYLNIAVIFKFRVNFTPYPANYLFSFGFLCCWKGIECFVSFIPFSGKSPPWPPLWCKVLLIAKGPWPTFMLLCLNCFFGNWSKKGPPNGGAKVYGLLLFYHRGIQLNLFSNFYHGLCSCLASQFKRSYLKQGMTYFGSPCLPTRDEIFLSCLAFLGGTSYLNLLFKGEKDYLLLQ